MEPKRKSGGADGGDLRASKRLKTVDEKSATGETRESTTKTGLEFLEQIRKTSDKTGRRIAKSFETLPPRKGNEAYYRKVRMPVSLGTAEAKLREGAFASLAELESYIKRMVLNAKEFYPRGSPVFDDAERIRKATSNFMVKNNPAYKLNRDYTAVATPIPDELLAGAEGEEAGEADAEAAAVEAEPEADAEADNAAADASAEPTKEDGAGAKTTKPVRGTRKDTRNGKRKDGVRAEEEEAAAEEAEEEEAEEEEEEEDEESDENDDDDDDEDDEDRSTRRRQGRGRGSHDTPSRGSGRKSTEPDHEYRGVPYKGLTFQQAQEKILEEVIRRPDEEEEGYAYFEPFLNLPSRALKDYFQVIKDPLSLKKLQKLVKGIRSRTDRSGVTEFKSWAAFEDKARLLWENAYFYNEDGSPIANMAKELESMFREELRKAKEAVAEPPQPKIKIKVNNNATAAAAASPSERTPGRKITIHVANAARGLSAEGAGSSSEAGGAAGAALSARGASAVASPSPSAALLAGTKREESARASPALGGATAAQRPAEGGAAVANGASANGQAAETATPPPRPAYESKYRVAGQEPLVTSLAFATHPTIPCGERRFAIVVPPHERLTQRSVTLNIPPGQWRQQVTVTMHGSIQQQQRPFKLFVIVNGAMLGPQSAPASPPEQQQQQQAGASASASASTTPAVDDGNSKVFEANLHPGINVIQVQLIAGLGKGQKTLPNGADAELEKVTIFANLMKV